MDFPANETRVAVIGLVPNGPGYVAKLRDRNDPNCFDVRAANAAVERALSVIADACRTNECNISGSHPPYEFTLVENESIKVLGGSYQLVDSAIAVSSAPFYLFGNSQIFLRCPTSSLKWAVYSVVEISDLEDSILSP